MADHAFTVTALVLAAIAAVAGTVAASSSLEPDGRLAVSMRRIIRRKT
jgi:hypothetical protein